MFKILRDKVKQYKLSLKSFHKVLAVLILFLVGFLSLFPWAKVFAAPGDVSAVRILGTGTCAAVSPTCNGYIAEIDIADLSTGGTYDFGFTPATAGSQLNANAKVKFNVTSPGYDTNGNTTTISRTVYGTVQLRRPYPNEALADETAGAGIVTVRVVLSEFIYSGDTVTVDIGSGFYTQAGTPNSAVSGLSVANSSTYSYPKPVGRWSWTPYERVTADFPLEATIFHRFAREGKPLAAVKFTCTDENSNTVTQTVNNMTVSAIADSAGTGNKVLVYATTMPIAGFTQGDVITCNFVAYPWVGDNTALLNSDLVANGGDGFAQPDDRLGPFALLNDKNGTYGTPCAIVASTGQASTASTWVYSSCAAAEAAYAGDNTLAYANLGYATQAVRTYNNTNHGHNDPGGGTIELQAQNYTTAGNPSGTTLGTQETWLTVQPASNVPCQTPVINANVSTVTQNVQKIKYSCISTSVTTGNTFRGNTSHTDVLWLDRMKLNHADSSWVRYFDVAYATRNTVDALPTMGFTSFSTVRSPWGLIRGNVYTPLLSTPGASTRAEFYNVIGNKNLAMFSRYTNADSRNISDNAVWAFNSIYNDSGGNISIALSSNTHTTFSHGIAIVQNVVETVGAAPAQPNIGIENMGGTDNINNLIAWHNTSRGQRSNVAYAADADHCSSPVPLFTNWTWKYNLDSNNNRIDEVRTDHGCPADSSRTGNWAMNFMVGAAGNALAVGGGPSWSEPDYHGLYTQGNPATEGFVNDKSGVEYGGADGGHGDYHLTSASSLKAIIPAGAAVLPFDIEGNARLNNGSGSIGAYEFSEAAAPVITLGATPTSVEYGSASTLNWSVTDATSCTASGDWTGSKATSGSESTGNLTSTRTYTLDCTGDGGSDSESVIVTVTDTTPPTITFLIPGVTLSQGQTSVTVDDQRGVTLEVQATDLSGIQSVSVTVNGQPVTLTNNTTPIGTTANGDYAVSVTATDTNNNSDTSALTIRIRHPDLNRDGIVNIFDLSILLSNWSTTNAAYDLNVNGTVDVYDLSSLLVNWQSTD